MSYIHCEWCGNAYGLVEVGHGDAEDTYFVCDDQVECRKNWPENIVERLEQKHEESRLDTLD